MTTEMDVMEEIYDAAIFTAGAIAISVASKKVTGEHLSLPTLLTLSLSHFIFDDYRKRRKTYNKE